MPLSCGNSITRKIGECYNIVTRPIKDHSRCHPPSLCRHPHNPSRNSGHVGWWQSRISGLGWGPVRSRLMKKGEERGPGGYADGETGEVKRLSDSGVSQWLGACNHRNRVGGEVQDKVRGKWYWMLKISLCSRDFQWVVPSGSISITWGLGPHPSATESIALVNNNLFFLTSRLDGSDAHLSLRTIGPA